VACLVTVSLTNHSHAQSTVTLYGIVDTGVEYVSHASSTGGGVVRVPSITGTVPSRWGLRGAEDLGGGYKAVFDLESGFNVRGGDSGQGGRLFGRQAWTGISGPFGTLTFGRQYTMTYLALLENDILGPAIYGSASLDNYIPNARSDNTVAYRFTVSGFSVGASYSFGRDSAGTGNSPMQGTCAGQIPGDFRQCQQWSVMLKYDAPTFGVVASYDQQQGGSSAAFSFFDGVTAKALTGSGAKDVRIQANGYVKLGNLKFSGGWLGRQVEPSVEQIASVRSDIFYVASSYQVTPSVVLDGGMYREIVAAHDTRATLATIRAQYFLSKATGVYAQVGYLANSAKARFQLSTGGGGTTPAAGESQTGVMLGIRHSF
jgi:predicted porin